MKTLALWLLLPLLASGAPAVAAMEKEYLTPKEIEKIQDAQDLDKRIKIYMDAADLRLKSAEERLHGKESAPEDPMEFLSVEDMLDGYYRIIRSVMLNLDDALQKPGLEREKLVQSLKYLKSTTERAQKTLTILKKIAEDKLLEGTWNAVNKALDITKGAYEGAELGLSRNPDTGKKSDRDKKRKPV